MPGQISFAGFTLSGDRFVHGFVRRKAGHYIQSVCDGIGPQNLVYLIRNNKDISEQLISIATGLARKDIRILVAKHKGKAAGFSDDELYSYLPEEYRQLFESTPGGKEWVYHLIDKLRVILIPS